MDATVLDVTDNGNSAILVRVSFTAEGISVNNNNVFYEDIPCVELQFTIPLDQEDYTTALQDQITTAIQNRLNVEFINRSKTNAVTKAVLGLKSLVGQTFSADTATVGDKAITIDGTVTASLGKV